MSEEKVNEIRMCNLRVSSGGSSDSDDGSKEMNDEMPEEPLMKLVKCTTEHMECQHRQSNWDIISYEQKDVNFFFWTIQWEKNITI